MTVTRLPAVSRLRYALTAAIPVAMAVLPAATSRAAEFEAGIAQYKSFLGEQIAHTRDLAQPPAWPRAVSSPDR